MRRHSNEAKTPTSESKRRRWVPLKETMRKDVAEDVEELTAITADLQARTTRPTDAIRKAERLGVLIREIELAAVNNWLTDLIVPYLNDIQAAREVAVAVAGADVLTTLTPEEREMQEWLAWAEQRGYLGREPQLPN